MWRDEFFSENYIKMKNTDSSRRGFIKQNALAGLGAMVNL